MKKEDILEILAFLHKVAAGIQIVVDAGKKIMTL